MILVDTSVWVDHLQKGVSDLAEALEREDILTHPFIIGELACGNLKNRAEVLKLLSALPSIAVASHDETLLFVEERKLMGKGIGYIDAHLLAAVTLADDAQLWTRDKRLAAVAENCGWRLTKRASAKTSASPSPPRPSAGTRPHRRTGRCRRVSAPRR